MSSNNKNMKYRILLMDLCFMAVGFSALTMFSSLKSYIMLELGLSSSDVEWAATAYCTGIFFAFLIGHSKLLQMRPKLTILLISLCVALSQFLIPFTGEPHLIMVLRFLQGLMIAVIPIFSYQGGIFFPNSRTLAVGIILSGIFIGGLVGSSVAPIIAKALNWKDAFFIFGGLVLLMAILLILTTPTEYLPKSEEEKIESKTSVWRNKFTWLWGFTFFPALWIIFSLAPLIHFITELQFNTSGITASNTLEASYAMWSVIAGIITFYVCKGITDRKQIFKGIAKVQILQYAICIIGALLALVSSSYTVFLIALILVAAIQGTGPTFWSIPTVAYDRASASRAGYAIGLISNSAALIGPPIVKILISISTTITWLFIVLLAVTGLILTIISLRLKLPIESLKVNKK